MKNLRARTIKLKHGERTKYEVVVPVPERAQQALQRKTLTQGIDAFTWEEAAVKAKPIIDGFKDQISQAIGPEPKTIKIEITATLTESLKNLIRQRLTNAGVELGIEINNVSFSTKFGKDDEDE